MEKIIRYIFYTLYIIMLLLFVIILPTVDDFVLTLLIGIIIMLKCLIIYNFEDDYWDSIRKLMDKIFGKEDRL